MEKVRGIFQSVDAAERAVEDLLASGIAAESVIFLSNQQPKNDGIKKASTQNLEDVPTTGKEGHEAGKSMGAAVGGAAGATIGVTAATTIAALLVPGLGTIYAIGLGAAALLGLGGAAVGAKVGDVGERSMNVGVPKDDIEFYRELLRNGRSVVIANADTEERAKEARDILQKHGNEDEVGVRSNLRDVA
jgi:hypothetical protein